VIPVKKFYITTPIYYINYTPSVGSAYTTIVADAIARWHRLKGEEVFYLTGLDENSVKTVQAAKDRGIRDLQRYADGMAREWKNAWRVLNISNDDFIRTTEKRHERVVNEFFMKVFKKGDIYKGEYKGLYCEGCEAFLTESDLVNGKCPMHKKPPKALSEENYFFRLSKYQDRLIKHIENNPEFVQPKTKRNEILNFIKGGLKDVSISRPGLEWGIILPIDKDQRFWVWFDALLNYVSGAPNKYWPADLHVIGKDILRFHCALWPAMLLSAGYNLPKSVFAHGFFTVKGEKMSKSLGNVIDPVELAKRYPVDGIRYFLVREIPFGEDGDFSEEALKARINGELVADLGNLVSRVLTLAEKHGGPFRGKPELEKELDFKGIEKMFDALELHHTLDGVWSFVRACNKYINDKEPWKLEGEKLSTVLYNLLEGVRVISILISPFMPETSERICKQLWVKPGTFKDLRFGAFKGKPRKGEHLFRKVD
jgi:methionyl-tRNA synthetase